MTEINREYSYVIIKEIQEEVFVDLKISCPAAACPDRLLGKERKSSFGVHSKDKGKIALSNRARIKCKQCEHVSHMKNGLFKCDAHHNGEYLPTSSSSFAGALFLAFNNQEVDEDVMIDLMQYLKKKENKW